MVSHILGHKRLTYQISAPKNDSSYVKHIYHSRYSLKMPNPHDLWYVEITEAQETWFSEGDAWNMVWNLVNNTYNMVYKIYNRKTKESHDETLEIEVLQKRNETTKLENIIL